MKALHRRTFLRGVGAGLSLPMLDAMIPAKSACAAPTVNKPLRMGFIFFANGAIMPDWTPQQEGAGYELSKSLKPLESVKDDVLVISGLTHDKARSNGDGAGDHARCSAAFLTAAQPRKTSGADIHVGTSVDQLAARHMGNQTRLPSLELGIEPGRQAGRCDSGYSCAYQSNIAWKTPTQPVAKEISPKLAFERLFGRSAEDAKRLRERDFYRQSILDLVADDAKRIRGTVGLNDRRKLDEYFNSVREIEQRIERSLNEPVARIPDVTLPKGIPRDYVEHIRLMYDMMVLAFQTDTTRIASFMLANSGSNRRYTHVDVKGGHHQLSHHRNDESKIRELQRVDEFLVTEYARFLNKLKEIPEGDGTLLDQCMILYGSGISDANRHNHGDLPIVMAGRGGGSIQPGRHLRVEKETPCANLFLSMLDRAGINEERFGDSTGRLDGLSA